ncbi:transcription factor TFIIIB component B'' homolog isoform X1 [Monodelphis domestica]|uniref:B double prime 1, subunit of RNA polymerase III transcription initiation factor IIIB n=1 Tax=Monodelphis domestica TaxID=13616 RepID=F7APT5_MONDO|nr:transcription factor TFIIIB component B'' homolog isoform X1 [Monodelphis domestica]
MFRRARLSVKPNVRPGAGGRGPAAPEPPRGQQVPREPEPAAPLPPVPAPEAAAILPGPPPDPGLAEPLEDEVVECGDEKPAEDDVGESSKSSPTSLQRRKQISTASSLTKSSDPVQSTPQSSCTVQQEALQPSPLPGKEKQQCSDRYRMLKAQKLREMLREEMTKRRKQWKNKYAGNENQMPPDRSKMTMRDLIYYLPDSNPMKSSLEQEAKTEKSTPVQTKEQEEKNIPDAEGDDEEMEEENNDGPLLVPRVKVAEDGSIILDEESLTVEVLRTKGPCVVEENDPIFERGSTTTYSSFRKNYYSKPWSNKETDMFFLAISMVGTDFSMIGQLFPHRARIEIKNKFKREEKANGWRIDKAFQEKRPFDFNFFARLLEKVLAEEEKRKQKTVKNQNAKEKKSSRSRKKQNVNRVASGEVNDQPDDTLNTRTSDTEGTEIDAEIVEKENDQSLNVAGQTVLESVVNRKKRKRKKKDDTDEQEAENLSKGSADLSETSKGEKPNKKKCQLLVAVINKDECNKDLEVSNFENVGEIPCISLSENSENDTEHISSARNQNDNAAAIAAGESSGPEASDLSSSKAKSKELTQIIQIDSNIEGKMSDTNVKLLEAEKADTSNLQVRGHPLKPKPNLLRTFGKKAEATKSKIEAESKNSFPELPGNVKKNLMEKDECYPPVSTGKEVKETENQEPEDEFHEKHGLQETEKASTFRPPRLMRGQMQKPKPHIGKPNDQKEVVAAEIKNGTKGEKYERESSVPQGTQIQTEDQSFNKLDVGNSRPQHEKEDVVSQLSKTDEPEAVMENQSLQDGNKLSTFKEGPVRRARFQKPRPNVGRATGRSEISPREKASKEISVTGKVEAGLLQTDGEFNSLPLPNNINCGLPSLVEEFEKEASSQKGISSPVIPLKPSCISPSEECEKDKEIQPTADLEQVPDVSKSKCPQDEKLSVAKKPPFVRSRFKRPRPNLRRAIEKGGAPGAEKCELLKKLETEKLEIMIQHDDRNQDAISSPQDHASSLQDKVSPFCQDDSFPPQVTSFSQVDASSPKDDSVPLQDDCSSPQVTASFPQVDASFPKDDSIPLQDDSFPPQVTASCPQVDASFPKDNYTLAQVADSSPQDPASPPHLDTSPPQDSASPPQVNAFPLQDEVSSLQDDTSSLQEDAYPLQVIASSLQVDASSSQDNASPLQVNIFPAQVCTSPHRLAVSPFQVEASFQDNASPPRVSVFPTQICASPQLAASPLQVIASPLQVDVPASQDNASPPQVSVFPAQVYASTVQLAASPLQVITSSYQDDVSTPQDNAFPPQMTASPAQDDASSLQNDASLLQVVVSPLQDSVPTTQVDASPTQVITSPAEDDESPVQVATCQSQADAFPIADVNHLCQNDTTESSQKSAINHEDPGPEKGVEDLLLKEQTPKKLLDSLNCELEEPFIGAQENDFAVSTGIQNSQQEIKKNDIQPLRMRGRLKRPRPNISKVERRGSRLAGKCVVEERAKEEGIILHKNESESESFTLPSSKIESEVVPFEVCESKNQGVSEENLQVSRTEVLKEQISKEKYKLHTVSPAQFRRCRFQTVKPNLERACRKKEEPDTEKIVPNKNDTRRAEDKLLQQEDSDTHQSLKDKTELLSSLGIAQRKEHGDSRDFALPKEYSQSEKLDSFDRQLECSCDSGPGATLSSVGVEEQFPNKSTRHTQQSKEPSCLKNTLGRRIVTSSISECEMDNSDRRIHRKSKQNFSKGRGSKRVRARISRKEPRTSKAVLVTLRASQEEDEEDLEDLESEYEEENYHLAPEEVNKAPVFVPIGLRSPEPVSAQIEETMEELEISVNVPDVPCITIADHLLPNVNMSNEEVNQKENLNASVELATIEYSEEKTGNSDGSTEAAIALLTMGGQMLQSEMDTAGIVCVLPEDDLRSNTSNPETFDHRVVLEQQVISSPGPSTLLTSLDENKITLEEQNTGKEVNIPGQIKENSIPSSDQSSKKTSSLRTRSRFPKPKPNLSKILGKDRHVRQKLTSFPTTVDQQVDIQCETECSASKGAELEDINLESKIKTDIQTGKLTDLCSIECTNDGKEVNEFQSEENQDKESQESQMVSASPLATTSSHDSNYNLAEMPIGEFLSSGNDKHNLLMTHFAQECRLNTATEVEQQNVISPDDPTVNQVDSEHRGEEEEQTVILTLVEIPTDSEEQFAGTSDLLLIGPLLPAPILVKSTNKEERGDLSLNFPFGEDVTQLSNYGISVQPSPEKSPTDMDLTLSKTLGCSLEKSNSLIAPTEPSVSTSGEDCQTIISEVCSDELISMHKNAAGEPYEKQTVVPILGSTCTIAEPQETQKEPSETSVQGSGTVSCVEVTCTEKEEDAPHLPQDEVVISDKHERTGATYQLEQSSKPSSLLSRPGRRPLGFLSLICSKNNLESEEATPMNNQKRLKPLIPISRRNIKRPVLLNEGKRKKQDSCPLPPASAETHSEAGTVSSSTPQVSCDQSVEEESCKSDQKMETEEEPTKVAEYFFSDIFMEVDETQ